MQPSRRTLLLTAAGALAVPLLAACGGAPSPTAGPAKSTEIPKPAEAPTPTSAPPTAAPQPASTATQAASPTAAPKPRTNAMSSPDFSVHVFLWGNPQTTQRALQLVNEMGFGWVKQMFEWRYIEPHEKGKFDWVEPDRVVSEVEKAGLKMIARLGDQPKWANPGIWPTVGPPRDLADFGNFVGALAERYKGRIQAYQIWNEPNLAREWGNQPPNPAQYAEMLRIANLEVKKADPNARVITAGLSPTTAAGAIAMPDVEFARGMYKAGARESFDFLGVHAAGYKAPPELSPDEIAKDPKYNHGEGAKGRIYGFRHAEDMRQVMLANGDADKRMVILEFGWTSDPRPTSPYNWHAVSEEDKASYLVRAYEFARKNWQPWIAAMNVIYVCDPAWTKENEQYYWSITNPDGTTRPAYEALRKMSKDAGPTPPPGVAPASATNAPAAAKPTQPTAPAKAPAKP